MALNEVVESIFQDHLQPDQNTQEKEVGASIKERTISPTDKVVSFQTTLGQTTKPKKRLLSWFCFSRKLCRNTQRNQTDFQRRNGKELQSITSFFQPASRIVRLVLYSANKTLINKAAVFSLQGVNKLHMRDTKGVRKFLYRRALV